MKILIVVAILGIVGAAARPQFKRIICNEERSLDPDRGVVPLSGDPSKVKSLSNKDNSNPRKFPIAQSDPRDYSYEEIGSNPNFSYEPLKSGAFSHENIRPRSITPRRSQKSVTVTGPNQQFPWDLLSQFLGGNAFRPPGGTVINPNINPIRPIKTVKHSHKHTYKRSG